MVAWGITTTELSRLRVRRRDAQCSSQPLGCITYAYCNDGGQGFPPDVLGETLTLGVACAGSRQRGNPSWYEVCCG